MQDMAHGLCLLIFTAAVNAWHATSTGFTSVLNDIFYYSPPKVVGTIAVPSSISISPGTYAAISVVSTDDVAFDTKSILHTFAYDDVWSPAFAEAVLVQYTGSGSYPGMAINSNVPNGPYLLSPTGSLYEVHRLYPDLMGAFTETITTDSNGNFIVLPAGVPGQSVAVAVPSRLYFTKTANKPLAGVRLAIKDIYDVAGLKKSNGNRAWYHLYPAANKTGPAMQRLIDAGAILVGKTKTSQFANGESATADWVDYHSPFNPRGDGYQQPSSSSSGSGSSAAAYDWLDLTTGSDTGGSIRGPSEVQGLFGNRPSHGLVSLDNVMPLATELDTAGFLTRDPAIWKVAAGAMYMENITFTSAYPTQVLTAGFPTKAADEGDQMLIDFANSVASFVKGNTSVFNITSAWSQTGTQNVSLNVMLNTTYPLLISREETALVRDPFYADYAAAHQGRRPFVNPTPLVRWSYSDNSTETLDSAIANKTIFMNWFNSEVLASSPATCSDRILLYVGSNADVSYRNVYLPPPSIPFGFSTGRWSVFSEAPDFVIPIGEAAYNSTITGETEYLPVTVDIMAAKGCDGMLFNLINDLVAAGIVKVPKAGKSPVEGGEVLYKRGMDWQ